VPTLPLSKVKVNVPMTCLDVASFAVAKAKAVDEVVESALTYNFFFKSVQERKKE